VTGPAAKLEARGLSKTFPASSGREPVVALEGVDLHLGAGELISIVGPSGCGKSTLLDILAGLVQPSAGDVLLDGELPQGLLGRIGYMPQRDLLMPWRTVLDNVTLGLEMNGVPRRDARERARADLPRFGLAGFERRRPGNLSGGMRQRAALLRTFLAGREVMLLDEPFGALDALTRQAMREWLLDIWQADRKSIVFVTHDVEEAVFLSDRVYVMSGRPGWMQHSVDVPLPRPRTFEMTSSPQFLELKAQLLTPLHAAAALQLATPGASA
jgi:ABC-type nitrate/sulfonate/bicarbonate transport system ATPase subunit